MPRLVIPGQALHVVQRGNNRQACFFTDNDYLYYLGVLKDAADRFGAKLHAYVLMTNHVHLLFSPDFTSTPSLLLQSIGRRYVRYINQMYQRSGTLWEGRFKSALIDSDNYLLTCSRYIELNPVRAGMVNSPADYRWSSYRANVGGDADLVLTSHPIYLSLGNSAERRAAGYQALFTQNIEKQNIDEIRKATESGVVLGSSLFKEQIKTVLNRRVDRHPHGGDRKSVDFLKCMK